MSKTKNAPAYLALVVDILERAVALGLDVQREMGTTSTLPENKQFCFVRVGGGTAALIVPKHADEVKWCDSHIDWAGNAGYVPLEKANGKVICRIDPSETDLDLFLTALSGASQRAKKASSKAASQEMSALIAKLQSLGLPAASPAPVETPDAEETEEDFEELSA